MTNTEILDNSIKTYLKEMIELQSILTPVQALSPENGGTGETAKCAVLESWLKKNGITNLEHFDAPDNRAEGGIRPNLVATIEGEDNSRNIWIISHIDVVPVGELKHWHTDPWKVVEKDGKLYGRGVEDDQQGLVASVFAALSFIRNGIKPQYTVKLLFSADEETGSDYGVTYLLNNYNLFKSDDFVVIPDGGDPEGLTIEVAEKNILWLKITIKGKQCHGANPDEGNNAFLAASDLALRLHNLETVFNKTDPLFTPDHSTFQPTKKEANVPNINTIPGEDIFYMDCRVLPIYPLSIVRKEIRRVMDIIENKYGVVITFSEPQSVESRATPVNSPVVLRLSAGIKKVYGKESKTIGIGGGTVAAYLRNKGIDAAVCGTLEEKAHQPNEYCVLENLINDARIMMYVMSNK